jgi:hypothetical protein
MNKIKVFDSLSKKDIELDLPKVMKNMFLIHNWTSNMDLQQNYLKVGQDVWNSFKQSEVRKICLSHTV